MRTICGSNKSRGSWGRVIGDDGNYVWIETNPGKMSRGVYIIPIDEFYDITGITIYKDKKFRIGEEPFNEIWQNMKNDRYLNIVR